MSEPSETPGWYAVALGADLDPATSTGTRLFGHELVVWRDAAGTAHVWEDRCPHRGMRLSFGFVRGDRIACLYHGWQYDAAGQCRLIPAHPNLDVSPMIRARPYPTRERGGLVWVRWGEDALPGPAPDAAVTPVRSLYAEVSADRLAAAFGGEAGPHVTVRADLAGLPVRVALQPVAPGQSAAHVVLAGTGHGPADRIRVAAACAHLRRALEAPSPVLRAGAAA